MRLLATNICLFIFSSCTYNLTEAEYSDDAVITGYDGRYCAGCCGGLIIYLYRESNQPDSGFHVIENPPSDLGIDPFF